MNSRERIITALNCGQPDKVPFMFAGIAEQIQEQILGYGLKEYKFNAELEPGLIANPGDNLQCRLNYLIHPDTARMLKLDALVLKFSVPLFCQAVLGTGGYSIEKGLLTSREALAKIRMPDVDDERIYLEAEKFVKELQGEFAIGANIRLGASPTLMSMGYEIFSYMLHDDQGLVCEVLDIYTDWMAKMIRNINELGFDFIWAFDDIAFEQGPLFSKKIWNELFFPRLLKVTERIKCPWIYHSDGNLLPILNDMLPLGMNGLHPLEPGAMDIDLLKKKYGQKICLVGNVDIEYTLTKALPQEIEALVKKRIEQLAPSGAYIISDSNSVPYYCKAENIIAVSKAVQKYRNCY